MPTDFHFLPRRPLINLITSGQTLATTPATDNFAQFLSLAQAAVAAEVDLFQIREKALSARALYELARSITKLTRGTHTKLLVNDRADIAVAAGADGVHLTTTSIPAQLVRKAFGDHLLIGVSTHSEAEARAARAAGANFIVFGPIFETPGKMKYGEPAGLEQLERVTAAMEDFPVLALGGVTIEKVQDCMKAGASGVAAIRMLSDPSELQAIVSQIRNDAENHKS